MRYLLILLFFWFSPHHISAQIAAPTIVSVNPSSTGLTYDSNAPAEPQVKVLHEAWENEHDPAKRSSLAGELIKAVVQESKAQKPEIVDEVARDGRPQNVLKSTAPAQIVALVPLATLRDAHDSEDDYPPPLVFRRLSAHRVEAWTGREGWLFDATGKNLVDIKVPRRDGGGREWFGSFLPNGEWITTDIWEGDRQLNAYNSKGKWLWELQGKSILKQLPEPKKSPDEADGRVHSSIGWARADRTGRRWLVSLGTEWERRYAFVNPQGKVEPLPEGISLWIEVYPRAMGVRGYYIELTIDSDDATETLIENSAGHGVWVGWPLVEYSGKWSKVVPSANNSFGFWPDSHSVYIEVDGRGGRAPHRVWFFDSLGNYEGEIPGSYLGDVANGGGLFVQDTENQIVQITHEKTGLAIHSQRAFNWPDGSRAIPLAIYDDLRLGFFVQGPNIQGFSDDAARARGVADIVLAKW